MIERLTIENFALIKGVLIDLQKGFTVITGETGAGKSIMLDALSLLMGSRADIKSISDKTKKTVIEAIFSEIDQKALSLLEEAGVEPDGDELIVRREISAGGRNRIFINDTPVNLSTLSSISSYLLDIHSQNSNLALQQNSHQLELIDFYAGNKDILSDYKKKFNEYVGLRNRIKRLRENIEKNKSKREFIEFQLGQLEKLQPREGEFQKLEKEFDILNDADNIRENLEEASYRLDGGDYSIGNVISEVIGILEKCDLQLFGDQEEGNDLVSRLNNSRIELKDISETLTDYLEKIETQPRRLAAVNARLNLYYDAIKHFKVKDSEELVTLHNELKEKLGSIEGGDEQLTELETEAKSLARNLKEAADKLTESRREASEKFSKKLMETATQLGLKNLIFEVIMEKGKLTSEGQDLLEFYCTFNKNHPIQPMSKIASGGEISRLMLSIKSIMASRMHLPTVIFDEVDTGVSGEIASKMGSMMKEMSDNMQVLSITHLPQVASKGGTHFKVYKTDDEEKTTTHIKKLEKEERVKEIAGMLSGATINEAAMTNARTLLENEI